MEEQQRRRNMQNEVAGVVKEGAVAKKSVVDGVAKHTHGLVSMPGCGVKISRRLPGLMERTCSFSKSSWGSSQFVNPLPRPRPWASSAKPMMARVA